MSDKPGEWNEQLQRYNPLTGEPPASERTLTGRAPKKEEPKRETDR